VKNTTSRANKTHVHPSRRRCLDHCDEVRIRWIRQWLAVRAVVHLASVARTRAGRAKTRLLSRPSWSTS
jgi:hypothetical protein